MTQVAAADKAPGSAKQLGSTSLIGDYSNKRILGLWAAGTGPMMILTLVLVPALAERLPFPASATYLIATILGMVWLLALSVRILKSEQGDLRWTSIRHRIWLNAPIHPKTGRPRYRLFLWLLPCLAGAFLSLLAGVILSSFALTLGMFLQQPSLTPTTAPNSPGSGGC